MFRIVALLAATAAFAAPAFAQAPMTDASTMTCADYLALTDADRPGILETLFGGDDTGGEGAAAGTNETALEETAAVSTEELAEACEGNDDMMISEAAEQARAN